MAWDDELICDKVEGGFIDVPSPTSGVGKIQLLPKLTDALKELPLLLCGPPGTGKHNLLKLATQNANLGMSTYDLSHISNNFKVRYEDLHKMLNNSGGKLQRNVYGVKSLLVLQGGEHLDAEGARLVRKYDVVILANERTAALKAAFGNKTFWVNRLTNAELSSSLQILQPHAKRHQIFSAVRVADGDLRKALRELQFEGHCVDKAPHVSFDVQDALCKGASKNMNRPCRAWLLENHWQVNKSLEEHALFSENLLAAELVAEHKMMESETQWLEADTMAECIASIATKKLVGQKRMHFSLNCPPDKSRFQDKSAAPQKLCQDKTQLESYFADNISMKFPWMSSKARNNYMHAIHGNGATVTETTDRPTKVTKTRKAKDVHSPSPEESSESSDSESSNSEGSSGSNSSSSDSPSKDKTEDVHTDELVTPAAPSNASPSNASPSDAPPPDAPPSDAPPSDAPPSDAPPPPSSASNIILDLKSVKVTSAQPFESVNEDKHQKMKCGSTIDSTRMRSEVIVVCPSLLANVDISTALKAQYKELKQPGITGLLVSKFDNCIAAFILKDKTKELKIKGGKGVTKALQDGRRSNETVEKQLLCFAFASNTYGDMKVEKRKEDEEMPDFQDAISMLGNVDHSAFRTLHANALKAKRYNRLTPLQDAILTYTTDLKEWLACKEEAESMIFRADAPGPHFLKNFKKDLVLNLRGLHYEPIGGIQTTTLKDAISKPQAPQKPPLLYAKTFIFVGKPATGKSEFVHAMCRECCKRANKDTYAMSASIDPYGLMTKNGKMKELGAVGFYDFELKAKINNRLSTEEKKGFLYVKERAHIGARYHQAVFMEYVPRFWAINIGQNDQGDDDPSEFFRSEYLEGLEKLVNEDHERIKELDGHQQAIARRAVIFVIDECLFDGNSQGATDAVACAVWEQQMQNATPLD